MATYNYIENTGVIIPDTATVLADVENEYKQIFGNDFVTDPETPEGALITAEVTSRQSVLRNNALLANQINPDLSMGTFFDAIWALTAGQRSAQTRSTVQVLCSGVAGTTVLANSRISDNANVIWRLASNFTIPFNGSISVSFASDEFGPVVASANTLTTIIDGTLGWETANNPASATLGELTQSTQSAKVERNNELALQGRSTAVAVTSNLNAIAGVASVSFRENVTNATAVIDGITLLPHSIWAAVDGGIDADIGSALLEAKSSGSNWNGAVLIPTLEAASGQLFQVRFDRPVDVPIQIRVTVVGDAGSDPTQNVIDAVSAYALSSFTLGADVSPFEIACAVTGTVTKVEVTKKALTDYQPATLVIELMEKASVLPADIAVVVL